MATEPQVISLPFVPPPQVPMGRIRRTCAESNVPSTIAITDPGMDLAKKTVCIKISLSTMGNTRKVSTAQIEADADKDLLRVSKRLVDSAELKAITRFDGEIRRFLYNICLPFEIGIHLLPITALEMVEHRLRQFAVDRRQLVHAFLSAYPSLCQDAATRLRGLYNPTDYPAATKSRASSASPGSTSASVCRSNSKASHAKSGNKSVRRPRCAWPKRPPKSRLCCERRWQSSSSTWPIG